MVPPSPMIMKGEPVTNPTEASTAPEKTSRRISLRFSARDLLNTAIFAVIYLILTFVFGMLGLFGPLVWLISVPVTIIVNGITFTLFLTRVSHAGMIMLFSLALALFFALHGGSVIGAAATLLIGIVTELVALVGKYRSKWGAVGSYTVYGLTGFIPFLPMVINREAYFGSAAWQSMGQSYLEASDQLFTIPIMGAVALSCLVAGFVGGLFGTAMLRKHFVSAGLA